MISAGFHNRRRRRRQRLREERLRSSPQGADGGDSRNSPDSGSKSQRVWGELSRSDLALVRLACRHNWKPSQPVRNAIARAVVDQALHDPCARQRSVAAETLREMDNQNRRTECAR
jgi:hypothetical protein